MSSRSRPVTNTLTSSALICWEIFFSLRRVRARSSRLFAELGSLINSTTKRTLWCASRAASSSNWLKRSPFPKSICSENIRAEFCKKPRSAHAKSIFQRVPDVLRLTEINHFFGDVLGVVGDAFEALRGDDPMEATADGVRIFHHMLRELLVNVLV